MDERYRSVRPAIDDDAMRGVSGTYRACLEAKREGVAKPEREQRACGERLNRGQNVWGPEAPKAALSTSCPHRADHRNREDHEPDRECNERNHSSDRARLVVRLMAPIESIANGDEQHQCDDDEGPRQSRSDDYTPRKRAQPAMRGLHPLGFVARERVTCLLAGLSAASRELDPEEIVCWCVAHFGLVDGHRL